MQNAECGIVEEKEEEKEEEEEEERKKEEEGNKERKKEESLRPIYCKITGTGVRKLGLLNCQFGETRGNGIMMFIARQHIPTSRNIDDISVRQFVEIVDDKAKQPKVGDRPG